MINEHTAYKYETPYNVPFLITRFWTNGPVNIQFGLTKIKYNIRHIRTYKSDGKVENDYFNKYV